jgi:hypothetical protein
VEAYLFGFQFVLESLGARMNATEAVDALLVDFSNLLLIANLFLLLTRELLSSVSSPRVISISSQTMLTMRRDSMIPVRWKDSSQMTAILQESGIDELSTDQVQTTQQYLTISQC